MASIDGMASEECERGMSWAALGVAAALVMTAWVLMFTWVPPVG